MVSRDMHYDFKQKLNKIDSQKYKDLLVPEIDWKLNEAQEVFVKMLNPRDSAKLGLESTQRTIDDIRSLVIDQKKGEGITPNIYDPKSYIAALPDDYWLYANSKAYATKGSCTGIRLNTKEVQHDDEHEQSVFDRSSFEWRVANIRFNNQGIRIFTDGTFEVTELCLDYIKRPRMIHNAQDYYNGTYTTGSGEVLTGFQNCELPVSVHREIVDIAVLITAGDLESSNYNIKANKLNLTK